MNSSTTPCAAVGYGRVSTDKQEQSIEAQRLALTSYAAARQLPPPDLIVDSDTSGSIHFAERDGARQLLSDCLAGKYQHLIVPKIDRLGRDAMDVQTVIQQLGRADVTVHIIDLGGSSFDTRSPISGMIIAVLAWAAQMMRDTIRDNVNSGLRHKRTKNELCGTVPFGWTAVETGEIRVNKGGKKIMIRRLLDNPEEQSWIRHMARLRAAGWGYHSIAKDLNERGVETKRGKGEIMNLRTTPGGERTRFTTGRWQAGNVAKVLNNKTVLEWLADESQSKAA